MADVSDPFVKRTTIVLFLVASVTTVVGAVIIGRLRNPERTVSYMEMCPGKVKQLGTSTQIYLSDNNDVFPAQDWYLATKPYTKNDALYTCNSLAEQGLSWGYAMNVDFAGKPNPKMKDYSEAVLFFETDDLRRSVIAKLNTLASPRHGDKIAVGRLDTSVKMLAPDEVLRTYGR